MNTRKLIVIGLLASCVVAGAGVAYQRPLEAVSAQSTIPPARYQVIADMVTMEQQIADLQRDLTETREDLREAQGRIGAITLLREYDIEQADERRASDLKSWADARRQDRLRLSSLERSVNALWEICR